MRKYIVAGNWKMNTTVPEGVELAKSVVEKSKELPSNVELVVAPPFTHLASVAEALKGSKVVLSAQNCADHAKGAYTGEISADMLASVGCTYTILGHSERREYFAETNETVNKKMIKCFEHGLIPIMCCGESLEQREQGVTMDFIRQQVKVGFLGLSADQAKAAIIAYEPIWAIGTGKTATSDQAEEVCKGIRDLIRELYGDAVAEEIRILYGGSVKGSNAAELFAKEDIDGGLVGGASLKPDFGDIVNYR
jgi:triosephosphate isomerase